MERILGWYGSELGRGRELGWKAPGRSLGLPRGWWFKKGKAWLRKLTRLAHGVPTLFLWRNIYIN